MATRIGTNGNDRLVGTAERDTLVGREGDDLLDNVESLTFTGTGDFRGDGNDLANAITGGAGADTLRGLDGADTLSGLAGRDYLIGGAGGDTLDGGAGVANTLQGGSGDDTYLVGAVGDSLIEFADEGYDGVVTALRTFRLPTHVEALTFTGPSGAVGYGNALGNVLTGGGGDDVLYGLDGFDRLTGGGGDDRLEGGGGDDLLMGGGDSDALIGGAGDDLYTNPGANQWPPFDVHPVGLSGRETIVEAPDGGNDTVQVGNVGTYRMPDNVERIIPIYVLSPAGLEFWFGPSTVIGNASNNFIRGGDGVPTLYGGDGDDTIYGWFGGNIIVGGNGNDVFDESLGNSTIRYLGGETGVDHAVYGPGSTSIGTIELSRYYYLPTDNYVFVNGPNARATSFSSTFLRDTNTNLVSFDADGRGPGAAVALLYYGGPLTVGDFGFFDG